MKRAVKWGRPQQDRGDVVRESKCNRYTIRTTMMANLSGRNGYFTVKTFKVARKADGKVIARELDSLDLAFYTVEKDNNPSWEPDE